MVQQERDRRGASNSQPAAPLTSRPIYFCLCSLLCTHQSLTFRRQHHQLATRPDHAHLYPVAGLLPLLHSFNVQVHYPLLHVCLTPPLQLNYYYCFWAPPARFISPLCPVRRNILTSSRDYFGYHERNSPIKDELLYFLFLQLNKSARKSSPLSISLSLSIFLSLIRMKLIL